MFRSNKVNDCDGFKADLQKVSLAYVPAVWLLAESRHPAAGSLASDSQNQRVSLHYLDCQLTNHAANAFFSRMAADLACG